MRFAVVCASNQNRSMEAHAALRDRGFEVESYGVGQHVKLPGKSAKEPNVYPFGTPYETMRQDLREKDEKLCVASYTKTGLLAMLERNASIKTAPERWQDCSHVDFDVVVTFEQRVFERVVEDLQSRSTRALQPVLVVNLETKDNHSEAAAAAPLTLKLCEHLRSEEDWEDEIESIVQKFTDDTGKHLLYTVHFG